MHTLKINKTNKCYFFQNYPHCMHPSQASKEHCPKLWSPIGQILLFLGEFLKLRFIVASIPSSTITSFLLANFFFERCKSNLRLGETHPGLLKLQKVAHQVVRNSCWSFFIGRNSSCYCILFIDFKLCFLLYVIKMAKCSYLELLALATLKFVVNISNQRLPL